jgi:hypothetical protein
MDNNGNKNQRSRGWCFTWNNYTEDDFNHVKEIECEYLVVGKEVGESGTSHLQGYIYFKEAKSWLKMRKLLCDKAHIEATKGTPVQASKYCKKDGDFFERGNLPGQGKRSDLEEVVAAVNEGLDLVTIATLFPIQWVKFEKGIRSLHEMKQEDRSERPICIWLWGKAGVGKSFYAINIHGKVNVFIKDEAKWWGTYNHEEAILIDDFDPHEWSYRRFLRLLDEGKYVGETKGGHIKINSKYIYISCEYPPEHFWDGNKLDQVETRFSEILEIRGECKRKKPVRRVIDT